MIASTRYLDLNTKQYSSKGRFLSTSQEVAAQQIKALRLRVKPEEAEQVVKDLQVDILGPRIEVSGRQSEPDEAIPFIACDREDYRLGDLVRVVFGANQPGWVHLYTVEPSGERYLLKEQEVSGQTIYELKARAEHPAGKHALLAVYSQEPEIETKAVPAFEAQTQTKGLRLIQPERPPYAIYRFHIFEH